MFGNGRSIFFKDSFYPHRLCYRQLVSRFRHAGVGSVTFPFYKLVTAKLSCSKGKFSVLIYHAVFRQCRYHRYITAKGLFDRYFVLRSRRLAFIFYGRLTAEKHCCCNECNAGRERLHKMTYSFLCIMIHRILLILIVLYMDDKDVSKVGCFLDSPILHYEVLLKFCRLNPLGCYEQIRIV